MSDAYWGRPVDLRTKKFNELALMHTLSLSELLEFSVEGNIVDLAKSEESYDYVFARTCLLMMTEILGKRLRELLLTNP